MQEGGGEGSAPTQLTLATPTIIIVSDFIYNLRLGVSTIPYYASIISGPSITLEQ